MVNVAIVGASGYTGLELIKILVNHPRFNITYVANSEGLAKLSDLHISMQGIFEIDIQKANAKDIAKSSDIAFLALPHKTSMSFAKELLSLGVKVVDLSADYRLELDRYEANYCEHIDRENLKEAVYGLPEIYKDSIKKAKLVANPGCYPTATLLGIIPFLEYIDSKSPIFIDAKSGVSGAGKKLIERTQFVTVNENMFAYNPLSHRHSPEIEEKLKLFSNIDFDINFVPQLIPVTRGMLVNIYLKLKDEYRELDELSLLKEFYDNEPFIRVRENPVDIKSTAGTNFCDIFVKRKGTSLLISSSIDNLLRGASSQAVVNANLLFGFRENLGINSIAYVP